MHEYSLVQSLLDQVDSLRIAERADRVLSIRLTVGEFCGIEPELFREAFDMLVDQTPAQGAKLEMTIIPLKAHCRQCGREFAIDHFLFACPACFSRDIAVTQGEDIILETVEFEILENRASEQIRA